MEFEKEVIEKIVSIAFDSNSGARNLRREIRRLLENPLSNKLLQGEIQKGDKITVKLLNDEIIFSK
jgi:ATP-dependent Clp protease ATP-binding subunit ClpA